MDEAEQLCDRLVVMDGGVIVAEGSPGRADRAATPPGRCWSCGSRPEPRPGRRKLERLAERVEELPDRLLLYTADGEHAQAELCSSAGVRPLSALVRRSTLEDVFLRLTGRSLVD